MNTARVFFATTLTALFVAGSVAAQAPIDAGLEPADAAAELTDALVDSTDALVDSTDAGSEPTDATAELPDAGQEPIDAGEPRWPSCTERVPDGATKPKLTEVLNGRGTSGHVAALEITIVHGKGEIVMPGGFRVERSSDAYKAIEEAGFVIPDPDGGAGPTLDVQQSESSATTKVTLSFVPLPKEPGRNSMVLPPLPITIARASGETMTLCTVPHLIVVEDPIANQVDPPVRLNPNGRPQREEWVFAKQAAMVLAIGLVLGIIFALAYLWWLRRPKPEPYVPPVLPWVAALEELEAIRSSNLIAEGKTDEYLDRVSDCVRKYLGARYGFDGLESTTDEMERTLARVRPAVRGLDTINRFLEDADLVKFARVVPAADDCLVALEHGITIVRNTTPAQPVHRPDSDGGAS